jgi:hypothetical protein
MPSLMCNILLLAVSLFIGRQLSMFTAIRGPVVKRKARQIHRSFRLVGSVKSLSIDRL